MDKETILTLASFPLEKQALVKGFILGLSNQEQNDQSQAIAKQVRGVGA